MQAPVRLVIADDHPGVVARAGLAALASRREAGRPVGLKLPGQWQR